MFLVGLGILLLASFLGSRLQGMSMSMIGSLGILSYMLLFNAAPAEPPFPVILCIAAVLTAVGTVEAAGGLHYLVQLAESCIRKYPKRILYISPAVTYAITFLGGTNHIAYSILPVIAAVSKEIGIRPERPLSLSVIAAMHGALASPISAIMATLAGFLTGYGIEMVTICKILIPSTMGGIAIAACLISQLSSKMPAMPAAGENNTAAAAIPVNPSSLACSNRKMAQGSILLFILGSFSILFISSFKTLRPVWEVNGTQLPLSDEVLLSLMMLSTACLIMLVYRISPKSIIQGKAFTAGVQGMFSLLGTAWLSSTFVKCNQEVLLQFIERYLSAPWQFSIMLLLMSALMGSSAATIKALFPLGLLLQIPPKILLASVIAVNGIFIIPIYPTILAAIQLDTTGSTRIGRFLFNHSFMLPGCITVVAAVCIAFALVATGIV
ncbi:MAG: anaerobic C4-dicarboxylate transporter family protein [Candidatus Cardinium sp.]|nr:anaerobic C4-dicarboxylate transporter family protein [Candidatus Cardinium sp.]